MSRCWNSVTLIGNVGSDPYSKTLPSGMTYCRVSVATSSKYKDKAGKDHEETEWHNAIAWGKLAEHLAKFITKGTRIAIKGHLHYNKFKDKAGNEKIEAQVVIEDFMTMSKGDNAGEETITIHNEKVDYYDDHIPF